MSLAKAPLFCFKKPPKPTNMKMAILVAFLKKQFVDSHKLGNAARRAAVTLRMRRSVFARDDSAARCAAAWAPSARSRALSALLQCSTLAPGAEARCA